MVPILVGSRDDGIRQWAGFSRHPVATVTAALLFSGFNAAASPQGGLLGGDLLKTQAKACSVQPGMLLQSHRAKAALFPSPEVTVHTVHAQASFPG